MIKRIGKGRVRHTLSLRKAAGGMLQVAESHPARLLLTLGQAVFEFEEAVKKSPRNGLEIEVPEEYIAGPAAKPLVSAVERLLSFVLLSEAAVSLVPSRDTYQTATKALNEEIAAVSLFSGGVDSVSGTLAAARAFPKIAAVFVSHLHQGRVISITRQLAQTYLRRDGVDLYEMPAPSMAARGYSQSRGWLYVMTAAAVAVWLGAERILVSECGPTMYQPKFGPADQTTMTTHPFVMSRAHDVIRTVAPKIQISMPFENLTKAEVMAVCPKPRAFSSTHSCISQRLELHDGTCYGCVVRRLAAIASQSPDVEYAANPITDDAAKSGNLLSLLSFSVDLLASPRTLPSYQRDMIFGHRKGALFRRFALDNLAALHRLKMQRTSLAPAVDRVYREALAVLEGYEPLRDRLRELRDMKATAPPIKF